MTNKSTRKRKLVVFITMLSFIGLMGTVQSYAQDVSVAERNALIALYNSTDGPNWTTKTNWKTAALVKDWYGVTVESNKVVRINLRGNNLKGPLPTDIGDLTNLYFLHFRDNHLNGSVPSQIGNLVKLKFLGLNNNDLTGALPNVFGALTVLKELYVQRNDFSGALPASLATISTLEYLYAFSNSLTSIPDFSGITVMKELLVKSNNLQFGSLEGNVGGPDIFNYSPQAKVSSTGPHVISAGGSVNLTVTVSGTANTYQWYKGGVLIPSATAATYAATEAGTFTCKIKNTTATGLTLTSEGFVVTVNSTEIPDWFISTVGGKNVIEVDQPVVATPAVVSAEVWVEEWQSGTSTFDYVQLSPAISFTDGTPVGTDLNQYTHATSSPATKTYKYAIKTNDASSGQSLLSDFQQSVHLTISTGLGTTRNLLWTSYLGNTVAYYEVWASELLVNLGTTTGNSAQLATVPSTANSFTDDGTVFAYNYYLIKTFFSTSDPLKGGSNKVSTSNVFSINDALTNPFMAKMSIYPNPVSDQARIEFDNVKNSEYTLYVMDLSGKVVKQQSGITGTELTINREKLTPGIYVLQMVGEHVMSAKMVVN